MEFTESLNADVEKYDPALHKDDIVLKAPSKKILKPMWITRFSELICTAHRINARGLLAGPMGDKIGRKKTLLLNVIPFLVGYLLIFFAENVGTVIAGRLLYGYACGVVAVVVPMYCVEISTSEVRGLLGSSFQGFVAIGSLLTVIIGFYVTWEYLSLFGAGVTTIGLICFFFQPETPRWIIAQGDMEGAIKVMRNLHGNHVDAEEECSKINDDLKSHPKGLLTLQECKHPTVYKPALIATVLMFFHQFSGSNAIVFYSSSIFEASKEFLNPKYSTMILGAVQVVSALSSSFIIDKSGRKILLFISGTLITLSLTILGLYYYISGTNTEFQIHYDWIPLVTLIVFIVAFAFGLSSIPYLLTSEIMPLRARATMSGLVIFANSVFAFIVTKTFSELEQLVHSYGTFWFYASITLASCFFVVLVVPETKGKNLEDIANYFNKTKRTNSDSSINVLTK
ncbi:facilitated trehalose transporter Tret1 [Caerostris extrusa]|uniref:Facilitated trehalose transporter Tret1 n=1 Tax=Caerostris extrusa TaxID=172846 RepID=A0AAV4P4T8_CAEEX|nr:facilitated trehalose transporter Tret1 [Caerostris extrusa]